MQHQDFHQLLTHTHVRVQGSHWVLENHRNLLGTQLIQLLLRQVEDVFTVKRRGPANAPIRGQQAH
ncbi:hypothetical protein D3C85_1662200 [compost metagenome]